MAIPRKRLLARGVIFGYGALVTQIFYSIASIPLALSFLSKAEFGLWGLITTLTGYLALLELGMTNSFQRHLIECRDSKEDGRYGRLFTASVGALFLVSLLVLILGSLGTLLAAPLFGIPAELQQTFRWVMMGNVAVAAFHMAFRMVSAPLYIHQRHDLIQLSQICLYVIMYGVLYFGFHAGWGLYAMLANVAIGGIWGVLFTFVACWRLDFYPPKGTLALPSKAEWSSVLLYSRDYFSIQAGNQLANSVPMLLLPRLLGLEATAVWTVCTRPFNILKQIVGKPYEYSVPILCEIYIKGEKQRMATRWIHITQLVTAIGVCMFSVGAANNGTFIRLWVGETIAWAPANDWLVALFFLVTLLVGAVFGMVGVDKRFGATRIAPYAEAILIAGNAVWMTRLWGLTGLLGAAILAQIFARLWTGLRYLSRISDTPLQQLVREALLRPLLILPLAALAAWACAPLHSRLPGYAGLLLAASAGTAVSGTLVLFLGVSPTVRTEILQMMGKPLGKILGGRR